MGWVAVTGVSGSDWCKHGALAELTHALKHI